MAEVHRTPWAGAPAAGGGIGMGIEVRYGLGEEEKKRGNAGEAGQAADGCAFAGILLRAPGTKRRKRRGTVG